jgi:hypothetical protein
MSTKKPARWDDLSRDAKLARILYPSSDQQDPIEQEISNRSANEQKQRPMKQTLLDDASRGCVSRLGGVANRREPNSLADKKKLQTKPKP